MIYYILFAVMPLASISVFGHIYLVELLLGPCLLLLPFAASRKIIRITAMDIWVLAYAAFNLVSVVVGATSLYESSRHYRLMVLMPVLVYAAIRFSPLKLEQLRKGLFLMLPAVLWHAALGVRFYLQTGRRPDLAEGIMDIITLSICICILITMLLYLRKELKGVVRKLAGLSTGLALFVALVVSATRASLLGLVAFAPVVGLGWNNKRIRRLISRSILGVLFAYLLLIFISPVLFTHEVVQDQRKTQVSMERLLSLNMYINDLQGRMTFAGHMAQRAMDHPILGTGAASYSLNLQSGVGMGLSSVHNFLISALITGGVPGLILTLALIVLCYRQLNQLPASEQLAGKLGKVLMVSFTVMLFVGITNDLTGGRATLFFFLLALSTRVYLLHMAETTRK